MLEQYLKEIKEMLMKARWLIALLIFIMIVLKW